MESLIRKETLACIVAVLFIAAIAIPVNAHLTKSKASNIIEDPEMAIIKVGSEKVIELPLKEVERIKDRLHGVANSSKITQETEAIESMVTILIEEGILPPSYTYSNIQKAMEIFLENLDIKEVLETYSCFSLIGSAAKKQMLNGGKEVLNEEQRILAGIGTFLLSFSIGGPVATSIYVAEPYLLEEIFNITILELLNISSYWTFATAAVWLPSSLGWHFAWSMLPFPGIEAYSSVFFNYKAIMGIYVLGTKISIVGEFMNGATLFDLTLGFYVFDMMLALG